MGSKQIFILNIFSIFINITLISCVGFSRQNESIIARSQSTTPMWLFHNGLPNIEAANKIDLVYFRGGLYNLSLGLKQAQSSARVLTSSLLLSTLQYSMIQNDNSQRSVEHSDSVKNALNLIVSQVKNKGGLKAQGVDIRSTNIEAVYWELKQKSDDNGTRQYYDVWILLSVSKSDYYSARYAIAHNMAESDNSFAATLGKQILQQKQE